VGLIAGLDTEVRGKILCPRRGSNPDSGRYTMVKYVDAAEIFVCTKFVKCFKNIIFIKLFEYVFGYFQLSTAVV
jgi:hypothetical protein